MSHGSDLASRNAAVAHVVSLLATAQYESIYALAPTSRVSPAHMRAAVEKYGRTLVTLPLGAQALIDYVPIQNANPPAWSVVVPLFTAEEGRSDLSLELQITRLSDGGYKVEVDDIHVL